MSSDAEGPVSQRLVPKAIRVLEEHLESGRTDAWRPALRVLEHGWGRPPEKIEAEPVLEDGDLDVTRMSTAQLHEFVRRGRERRKNAEALALVEEAAASTPDAPTAEAV